MQLHGLFTEFPLNIHPTAGQCSADQEVRLIQIETDSVASTPRLAQLSKSLRYCYDANDLVRFGSPPTLDKLLWRYNIPSQKLTEVIPVQGGTAMKDCQKQTSDRM